MPPRGHEVDDRDVAAAAAHAKVRCGRTLVVTGIHMRSIGAARR